MNAKVIAHSDYLTQRRKRLQRYASRFAAAWTDFHLVEQMAADIVSRFGDCTPWAPQLRRNSLFMALQRSCVLRYARPYCEVEGIERFSVKYAIYTKREWQEFHEDLLTRADRLSSGANGVAPPLRPIAENANTGEFPVREDRSVLEPRRDFAMLRAMCADRKALLWPDLQEAVSNHYLPLRDLAPLVLD